MKGILSDIAHRPSVRIGHRSSESCIVTRHDMSADDKRDRERVPVPSPLYGEVKVYQPMTILDISKGGLLIETPFALQLDSLHDFKISLGDLSIVVKGRIAYCHIGELT